MIREGWYKRVAADLLIWVVMALLCMLWRWIDDKSSIAAYWSMYGVLAVLWVLIGFVVQLYRSYKEAWLWQAMVSLVADAAILIGLIWWVLPQLPYQLSPKVATWSVLIVGAIETVLVFAAHYWKYATNMTVPAMQIEQRKNAQVTRPDEKRRQESIQSIHQSVLSVTTEADYYMLRKRARLDSRQTKVICDRNRFAFLQIPDYQYKTLVDLTLLNDAKGINRRFCIVNQKLPDDGIYVCCYRPQEYMKSKLLAKFPPGLNWIVYCLYFFRKRVLPRLMLTSRLYYDVTKGRKRMLSKTEVLGRLYYCGFEVDEIVPMGHIEYVFAHRHSQPYPQEQLKVYGPLIKLPRVCKNKEIRYFYKFRTMHPYAEYIQKYVFDARGGMDIADKSNDDWRITTWGKFMRKYWLDELPMLINWLKRDVKLVGVRPLSKTMFETYPEWLQDKRTKSKPGLIPPFYIDHPDTFEELFASEDKYLTEYLEHPIRTDIKYFFLTMRSILTRKTHSA
jgi:lipopolysaccharide/colanic/teichoic acid biosynthesis glycosyltransferase